MEALRRLAAVVGLCVAPSLAGAASAAPEAHLRYHYVSLGAAVPAGYEGFFPASVTDYGWVYGNTALCIDPDHCTPKVAVYRGGKLRVLHDGLAYDANESGTIGGSLLLDPANNIEQAALFDGARATPIPRLPGELTSHVSRITDSGIALVDSTDATTSKHTFYLYRKGKIRILDLGAGQVEATDVNDRGQVSGTAFDLVGTGGDRAFRLNPATGKMTLLDPLPTEPRSWGVAINERGDVLGYSFVAGHTERVGVWRGRRFVTYFVEGTPEVPTVSNRLLWNEHGLIVISVTNDQHSYVVPRPGLRLNLNDLSDRPVGDSVVQDVNDAGDVVGVDFETLDGFLLQRVRPGLVLTAQTGRPSADDHRFPRKLAAFLVRRNAVADRVATP